MSTSLRHTARECALRILYTHDILRMVDRMIPPFLDVNWWDTDDKLYVPKEAKTLALEWVTRVDAQGEQIDECISGTSLNWRVDRMPPVERNILRLAVMEIFEYPEIEISVIINEALELAKCYGDVDSPRFINGILDTIGNAAREEDAEAATTPTSAP